MVIEIRRMVTFGEASAEGQWCIDKCLTTSTPKKCPDLTEFL